MNIALQQFEGPLDVLLLLIEKNKLDISTISLARITDQYLSIVNQSNEHPVGELVSFLEIASRLIVLKTRLLLPYLTEGEDEEDETDLVEKLNYYKQYHDAGLRLALRWNNPLLVCLPGSSRTKEQAMSESLDVNPILLKNAIVRLARHLTNSAIQPIVTLRRIFNVREKIAAILDALKNKNSLFFSDIIESRESRTEIVVSFLALLELCKKKQISIEQKTAYSEIHIYGAYQFTT